MYKRGGENESRHDRRGSESEFRVVKIGKSK